MRRNERGSAIILLFIMVALFGLISYAFLNNSRGGINWIKQEQGKASTTQGQDCSNAVNLAVKRLEMRGCGTLISYDTDGTNTKPGAPGDGKCSIFHVNGGAVKPCGSTLETCSAAKMLALAVGESCGDLIYAGVSGGRLYVAKNDVGSMEPFNNGSFGAYAFNSTNTYWSNGQTATNILVAAGDVGAPYRAAYACRAMGAKWFVPSKNQLDLMYSVRNTGSFSGTYKTDLYWSSNEGASGSPTYSRASSISFSSGSWAHSTYKNEPHKVRCARFD